MPSGVDSSRRRQQSAEVSANLKPANAAVRVLRQKLQALCPPLYSGFKSRQTDSPLRARWRKLPRSWQPHARLRFRKRRPSGNRAGKFRRVRIVIIKSLMDLPMTPRRARPVAAPQPDRAPVDPSERPGAGILTQALVLVYVLILTPPSRKKR